jgi:hypothetical protein
LGTGRPVVLRDENSIRRCRILLTHRMASPTDVRLISQVELVAQKSTSFFRHTWKMLIYVEQLKFTRRCLLWMGL